MGTAIQKAFPVLGMKVPYDEEGRASLTAIWIAAGRPAKSKPAEWLRSDKAKAFIAELESKSKVGNPTSIKVVRGTGLDQGTWGHWQIALAYASWLSPRVHQDVQEGYRQWKEEEANPGLKIERGIGKYRQLGFKDEWIGERVEGIITRKALTSTMRDHNCKVQGKDNPYAEGTRAISLAVHGKTPREIREEKGLTKKSQSTRDHLDEYQLIRLRFAESEAKRLIQEEAAEGNEACVGCCRRAGNAVKVAVQSLAKS